MLVALPPWFMYKAVHKLELVAFLLLGQYTVSTGVQDLDEDRRYEPENADTAYTTDSQMRPGAVSSAAYDCFADGNTKSDRGPEKLEVLMQEKVLLRQGLHVWPLLYACLSARHLQ